MSWIKATKSCTNHRLEPQTLNTSLKRENSTHVVIHVVDWRVWNEISADKQKISELLFSGLVTYSIDVESGIDEYERFSLTMPENKSLNELLDMRRCSRPSNSDSGSSAGITEGASQHLSGVNQYHDQ